MNMNCQQACNDHPLTEAGEPEQCIGWAAQGECTRNPKFMMHDCPKSCREQRLQMHEGLLDDRADCLDVAKTQNACITHPDIASGCAGTCKTHEFCASEADPEECERALRCRELKDDWSDCASRVADKGCEDEGSAATLLKHCYLSCARVGRASLLRRFRLKYTVRTRKHGYIDEDELPGMGERLGWRPAFSQTWSLPCWKSTVYDERPPATCANPRAEIVHRWLKMAEPKCRALKETTPRAPPRRTLELPYEHLPRSVVPGGGGGGSKWAALLGGGDGGGGKEEEAAASSNSNSSSSGGSNGLLSIDGIIPPVRVLPLLLSPKVRLVENFVTPEEAAHVIEVGTPNMHRSLAGGRTESIRTSSTAMLPAGDEVVKRITERAALLTGYPYENVEPLQLVKYVDGQKVKGGALSLQQQRQHTTTWHSLATTHTTSPLPPSPLHSHHLSPLPLLSPLHTTNSTSRTSTTARRATTRRTSITATATSPC